jgi:integrase/recombinase XerD
VTHLRRMMLEELQRRNYAKSTVKTYIRIIQEFASHFHQSPDRLGPQHLRQYQAYLFQEKKLDAGTVQQHVAALRFFYVKTLKRRYLLEDIPRPKRYRKLPEVLSPEEVAQLIDSASNLFHRTMLMTLYSTGIRRAELCRLQIADIDSQRMMVHIRQGKGGQDRDIPLSEKLLETLRVYWRWMKPKNYLFPGTLKNWRADVPVTTKVPWEVRGGRYHPPTPEQLHREEPVLADLAARARAPRHRALPHVRAGRPSRIAVPDAVIAPSPTTLAVIGIALSV